jgi:homoserine dehydrogenase
MMTLLNPAPTQHSTSHSTKGPVGVGLIGLGTVGGGVYKLLAHRTDLTLHQVAVRSLDKARSGVDIPTEQLTLDPMDVVNNPAVQVVVEVAGGLHPAKEWVMAALSAGKHVVTANKALIATYGEELFALAARNKVRLLLEGAVAGGIPIILPLRQSLAANEIVEIAGILNGTTNYILTRMGEDGWTFDRALQQAQALGFAEADPTSDVGGQDAAYKIAILASLALNQTVPMDQVFVEGITNITPLDINYAKRFNFTIRLIGLARRTPEGTMDVRVHPMLVPNQHPLSSIRNEYNAVVVEGSALGPAMFYGKGAGELPTASAVAGDILALVADLKVGNDPLPCMAVEYHGQATVAPIAQSTNRYYIRLNTLDQAGVIAQLGKAFGDADVSLESFLQIPGDEPGTASLIVVTHAVKEHQLQTALAVIEQQASTRSVGCLLRVL